MKPNVPLVIIATSDQTTIISHGGTTSGRCIQVISTQLVESKNIIFMANLVCFWELQTSVPASFSTSSPYWKTKSKHLKWEHSVQLASSKKLYIFQSELNMANKRVRHFFFKYKQIQRLAPNIFFINVWLFGDLFPISSEAYTCNTCAGSSSSHKSENREAAADMSFL